MLLQIFYHRDSDIGNHGVTSYSGQQTRDVTCQRSSDGQRVDASLCNVFSRPDTEQSCNTQPCNAQ